jgi:hypothetical protein
MGFLSPSSVEKESGAKYGAAQGSRKEPISYSAIFFVPHAVRHTPYALYIPPNTATDNGEFTFLDQFHTLF